MAAAERLAGTALTALVRLITGLRPLWLGCAPEPGRQRVYFANHSSHLDGLVLWAALPPALRALTRPVAAADYWGRPGLRSWLARRVFDAVLVERHGALAPGEAVEQILAGLGGRHSLIFFPEGTRGAGGAPGPFRSGLYHIARARPELELVPVYLENLNRALPKGEVLPVPILGSARFGAPLSLGAGEDKSAFLTRARAAVLALRDGEPQEAGV